MSKQFKVVFYLRSGYKTKDGKTPVLMRIYYNNERLSVGSAGINVVKEHWDNIQGRVQSNRPDAATANNALNRIETDLTYLFRRHEFDEDFSLALIKSEYLGDSKSSESFMQFFQQVMTRYTKRWASNARMLPTKSTTDSTSTSQTSFNRVSTAATSLSRK